MTLDQNVSKSARRWIVEGKFGSDFFFLLGERFVCFKLIQRPQMALGAEIVFALPTPVMNM